MAGCDSTLHTGVDLQHIASSHGHSYAESASSEQLVQVLLHVEAHLGVEAVEQQLRLPVLEGDPRSIAHNYTFSIGVHRYSRIDHHSGT